MSETLAKESAAAKKELGKLEKLWKALQKFFAKEFLWILAALLLGLPLALMMAYIIEAYTPEDFQAATAKLLNGNPLFIGCYIICLAGIYFTRMVVNAIKVMTEKPKS